MDIEMSDRHHSSAQSTRIARAPDVWATSTHQQILLLITKICHPLPVVVLCSIPALVQRRCGSVGGGDTMSSLRNAVKRVTHKERSQPTRRAHLGALEKHQDYVKRAKDFHRKEDAVNAAKQRAALRNPDEFYFGMHKSVVDAETGKHRKTQEAVREEFERTVGDADAIRVLKDQDLQYIRLQRQRDAKKVEKLKASLHGIGQNPLLDAVVAEDDVEGSSAINKKRKHTLFVDSKEEFETFDVARHFDTLPELAERSHNRLKVDQLLEQAEAEGVLEEGSLSKKQKVAIKRATRKQAKARIAAYREMMERQKRVQKLTNVEAQLVLEKQLSAPGRKRKIKAAADGKPAVYR
jgi:U3 small nucleolar RNA-associated protein 11